MGLVSGPVVDLPFLGRQSVNVAMDSQVGTESLQSLTQLSLSELRALWPQWCECPPPARLRRNLLIRALAYRMQERLHGGLSAATRKKLRVLAQAGTTQAIREGGNVPRLTPGTQVIREWGNEMHQVTVEATGFVYRGHRYQSLSEIARKITGTRWSGPVFFGVTPAVRQSRARKEEKA